MDCSNCAASSCPNAPPQERAHITSSAVLIDFYWLQNLSQSFYSPCIKKKKCFLRLKVCESFRGHKRKGKCEDISPEAKIIPIVFGRGCSSVEEPLLCMQRLRSHRCHQDAPALLQKRAPRKGARKTVQTLCPQWSLSPGAAVQLLQGPLLSHFPSLWAAPNHWADEAVCSVWQEAALRLALTPCVITSRKLQVQLRPPLV